MEKREFGKTADGREAGLYILKNEKGMVLKVTDLGAAIVSLQVPDREENSGTWCWDMIRPRNIWTIPAISAR